MVTHASIVDTQEGELSSLSNVVTEGSMPASGSHTDLKAPSSPGLGTALSISLFMWFVM